MTGHSYLIKSRHGVYYFRAILPRWCHSLSGHASRELRVSLRTKDKYVAKQRVARKVLQMSKLFDVTTRMEADLERRHALYVHGLALMRQFKDLDPADEFDNDTLLDELSGFDRDAYFFAYDQTQAKAQRAANARSAANTQLTPSALVVHDLAACAPASRHATPPPVVSALIAPAAAVKGEETVARAIERFVDQKGQHVDRATAEKYGKQCQLFAKVVAKGRQPLMLSHLTADDLRFYVDLLPKLPKKVLTADPRPIDQIIAIAGERMAPKTKFSHAQAVNMFLVWCAEQQYTVVSNATQILKPLLKKPKPKSNVDKTYSDDELKLIFECEQYRTGAFRRPSDFWLPLLGLFTGAREAELCQLDVSDVQRDAKTDIWFIAINASGDKKLKNESSKRDVPIHPQLVELGFLDYVAAVKGQNSRRLFPDEQRSKKGEFSAFSKRYNRLKSSLGIKSGANTKNCRRT